MVSSLASALDGFAGAPLTPPPVHGCPILAAVNTGGDVVLLVIVCAVLLVTAALAHGITAKLLVPDWAPGRVAVAALLHAIISVIAIFALPATDGGQGARLSFGVQIAIFCGFAAAMVEVHRINLLRAIGYTMLASVFFRGTLVLIDRVVIYEWTRSERARKQETRTTAASPGQPQQFASVEAAKAAAVRRYPDLEKAGTSFNQRFLAKHAAHKAQKSVLLNSPDWPWQLAVEVAGELGVP